MMSCSLLDSTLGVMLASNRIPAGVSFGMLGGPDRGPHVDIFSECSLQF